MIVKCRKCTIIILLFAMVLTLFSCSKNESRIPKTSDNFTQEFMDVFLMDYCLADPQLYYISMLPYEVRLDLVQSLLPGSPTTILISSITNVDQEQFVAVTHYNSIPSLMGDSSSYVYQRQDAPNPMKDYTIFSISVVGSKSSPRQFVGSSDFEILQKQALNYFEAFIDSEYTEILAEYKAEVFSTLVTSLRESYNNTSPNDLSVNQIFTCDEGDTRRETAVYYYLLFKFKETDSLVWFVPIFIDNITGEQLYYGYDYYDTTLKTTEAGEKYLHYEKISVLAPISDEIALILRDVIH